MNNSTFIKKPSTPRGVLILGVGINDANYAVKPLVNGKVVTCKIYRAWNSMLERCYSRSVQKMRPTYKGCTVCGEWLIFSNFESWAVVQDWEGMQLDKDLIEPGNKIYSAEKCCFISSKLNKLITNNSSVRGKYPIGVVIRKTTGRYEAAVRKNSKKMHIGSYDTPFQASEAYVKAKTEIILQAASEQTDPRIANGLRLHAKLLRGKSR